MNGTMGQRDTLVKGLDRFYGESKIIRIHIIDTECFPQVDQGSNDSIPFFLTKTLGN